jgi:acetylornithine/succinyldiaminopimelate/putrescine aminotransferase
MTQRQLFLQHVGQTSETPLCFEIAKAEGSLLYDVQGKKYIDLIGGISVANVGHGNEHVKKAVHEQVDKYMHTMVYGEMVLSPQVDYAVWLAATLPANLQSIFYTTSGSEATEGAMKLAKRYTGRSKIISFKNSYHGSTQGALSIMGSEYWQQAFRPLLPNIFQFAYNDNAVLAEINTDTACIIMEVTQAEAGIIKCDLEWMQAIRNKCTEVGALLIFDEIQTGFGRTGSMYAFEQINCIPDVLLLGKALGGGMPMGAFVSSNEIMKTLSFNPVLGHINTFGGHPVCCAAGLSAAKFLIDNNSIDEVQRKEILFMSLLKHNAIQKISSHGLLMALHFENYDINKKIIDTCIENGVFTDWFLFASNCLRIAPPLIITDEEIKEACAIILQSIHEWTSK